MGLVDQSRKEELILAKQIRQSSTKMLRRNLPPLIEASPDMAQKKLPYFPHLPQSVQLNGSRETISTINDSWYGGYSPDNDIQLYTLPHQINRTRSERSLCRTPESMRVSSRLSSYSRGRSECRSPESIRPDSRRSRSSSITFDLDSQKSLNKHKKKDKEKNREERNQEKRKERRKKQREQEERSQADVFAEEKDDKRNNISIKKDKEKFDFTKDEEISMWACRKCTLENRLDLSFCQVCGGSRLSSIGEVNLDQMTKAEVEEVDFIYDWTCSMCTLVNPITKRNCEACGTKLNPKSLQQNNRGKEIHLNEPPKVERIVRYLGIFLIAVIFFIFLSKIIQKSVYLFYGFIHEKSMLDFSNKSSVLFSRFELDYSYLVSNYLSLNHFIFIFYFLFFFIIFLIML